MPTRPDGKPYLPPGEATRLVRKVMEDLSKNKDNTGYVVAPLNPLVKPRGATISEEELGEMKKMNPN